MYIINFISGQYPGLFIFTGAARMMRPVWNISSQCVEYIGTFEQVIREEDIYSSLRPFLWNRNYEEKMNSSNKTYWDKGVTF